MSRPTMVPVGPVLTPLALAHLPIVAGRWLVTPYLRPVPFGEYAVFADLGVLTGIYLITDAQRCVRWLGQACREDGLVGRLDRHHTDPVKRAAFASVRVLHLADMTPVEAIDAIEGRCADLLGLRGVMCPRRWPSSAGWPAAVA